ncbi:MAG: T9SS type A sorting domain-containing protein [Bacteroidota bacterium]
MKKIYLLALCCFCSFGLSAQCLIKEISIETRIQAAEYIVEGKVIAKQSFWDDEGYNIYTSNTILLHKTFKGQLTDFQTIELITRGGIVGLEMQIDHPRLQLNIGDIGLFLLHPSTIKNEQTAKVNALYCTSEYVSQGYIKYNFSSGKAVDGHTIYEEVTTELYTLIEQNTGKSYRVVAPFNFDKMTRELSTVTTKSITSFSPTTITAGTESILTINGTNFGNSQGSIEFANADNGGATINIAALSEQIKTWTNTQITVEVPSDAGTGNFEIITTSNGTFTSSAPLVVSYNQSNAENSGDAYPTQFVDDNGMGGITFQYHTDFADGTDLAGADLAFLRAMNTWCTATNINWIRGADSNVDIIANDGVNIVRFGPIPGSTIGRTTSRWFACGSGGVFEDWYVSEIDIVFNENTNWYIGNGFPSGSQSDFESVALHELGHAHQLGHTNNGTNSTGDVMYFQILNGSVKRALSTNDEAGADDVFARSNSNMICSQNLMIASDCGTLPVELLYFDGKLVNTQALLSWETASEFGNAGFEVQQSQDTKNWKALGFVKGHGTTLETKHYKYYDEEPKLGVNYYRLKQIDTDKNYEYSELISVYRKGTKKESLTIFPNPVSNNLRIQLQKNDKRDYQFQLLDTYGNILRTWFSAAVRYDLSTEDLPSGSYIIIAKSDQDNFSKRFVKQ